MKYSNIEQNVTPLEMLPDLEDLEKNDFSTVLPPGDTEKFARYIRNYQNGIAKESGMTQNTHSVQPRHLGHHHQNHHHQNHHHQNHHHQNHQHQNHQHQNHQHQQHHHQRDQNENYDFHKEEDSIKTFNMPDGTPSCLDVAEHIANCPICSKFYSTDKTIYIIAIVILSIICILLLKKVLDI